MRLKTSVRFQALYCELLGMFRDRLISEEHVQQFEGILKQTMRKYYGKDVSHSRICQMKIKLMY